MTLSFSKAVNKLDPSGIRKFFDLVIGEKDIISLGVGEPDFPTPWHVREEAIYTLEKGMTSYTSNYGLLECREAVCDYLKRKFKANYNPKKEIIITLGVSQGVDIALRSILDPGDEVILPEPSYVCYKPLIQLLGAKVVSLDTTKTALIPDPMELEKKITNKTKAIILCSPNNPTGAVIPKKELVEIAELAEKHDLWVISDEIYADLSFQPYTSFASIEKMKKRTILLSGFSKAFAMTGWRIGYLCGPEELIAQAIKIHQYSALCAPITGQYAGIEALKHSEKDVEEMKMSYLVRRNLVIKRFKKMGLEVETPQGAFYCFPSIKNTGLSSEEFALQLLKQYKVAVVPGSVFGEYSEGYIRCCFATGKKELIEALDRIEKFIKKLKK